MVVFLIIFRLLVKMAIEYEFSEADNLHYIRLGRKSIVVAIALITFGIANMTTLWNTPIINIPLFVSSALLTVSSLYAAVGLQRAAAGFFRIANTQGNDISILHSSNNRLQQAFTGISIAVVILCIRYIAYIPVLAKLVKCGAL